MRAVRCVTLLLALLAGAAAASLRLDSPLQKPASLLQPQHTAWRGCSRVSQRQPCGSRREIARCVVGCSAATRPSSWQLRRRLRHASVAAMYLVAPVWRMQITSTDAIVFASLVVGLLFWTEVLSQTQQVSHFLANLYKAVSAHRPTMVKLATTSTGAIETGTNPTMGPRPRTRDDPAARTARLAVEINMFLTIVQIIAGVQGHSTALVADAMHTLSDVASDLATLWAVQVAQLPPDRDHPYGHGRVESLASLLVSLMLLGVGGSIGSYAFGRVRIALSAETGVAEGLPSDLISVSAQRPLPSMATLVIAAITVLAKEWLYHHTVAVGKRLNSPVLVASAWHHRSDALTSVLTFVAILAALTTRMTWIDGAAGLMVAVMISWTAVQLIADALTQLLDTVDPALAGSIRDLALSSVDGVRGVEHVRTRAIGGGSSDSGAADVYYDGSDHGSRQIVDMIVRVDPAITMAAANDIAVRVRAKIKAAFPSVAEVVIQLQAEDVAGYQHNQQLT